MDAKAFLRLFGTGAAISLYIYIFIIGLFVALYQQESQDRKIKDDIYWIVIYFVIVVTAVGFLFCIILYSIKHNERSKTAHPYYARAKLKDEEKKHTLDNIFGFLAGLAITTALTTYSVNYLGLIDLARIQAMGIASFLNFIPTLQSIDYFIPTLHLIDFFVVAIPFTHSGYNFLTAIASREWNTDENTAFRLIGFFILSIILVALFFFLGGSIADRGIVAQVVNPLLDRNRPDQSDAFVFWLTLIVAGIIAWSLLIRYLIGYGPESGARKDATIKAVRQPNNGDRITITERVHKEWIWLDVFTFGFLVVVSLTIFRLDLLNNMYELLYFNIALSSVLVARAVLNYYIGLNIYFPLPE
jgi:hypothetical protein